MPGPTGAQKLEACRRRLERHSLETDPDAVLTAAARFLEVRSRSVDAVSYTHLTLPTKRIV